MRSDIKIPKRIASIIIHSLKGGVVPRLGLPYITVGRKDEIDALLHDMDIIADGGASFRFIVGKYGSGKSFLLQSVRNYMMDNGFVVADCDLSPERRLQGTKGQGLATYKELIQNIATKTRPEGGALNLILDKWIMNVQNKVATEGDLEGDALYEATQKEISNIIMSMDELVHGFDFAKLIKMYYKAYYTDDAQLKSNITKWFRGEYSTKTEAKNELMVNIIVSDDDWYEYIKLFAQFFKMAGYKGFMIMIDELVNIYKIPNAITRQYNYEKILTMYNDTLQGKAKNLGFIMCGTPLAIEDKRRGVYSYEALRSRLTEGKFSREGARDMLAPIIRLDPLSAEEMLVLCGKLASIHEVLYDYDLDITDEDLSLFIRIEYTRVGADTMITPREIIRDFIELLDILYQKKDLDIKTILNSDEFSFAKSNLLEKQDETLSLLSDTSGRKDDFASFNI